MSQDLQDRLRRLGLTKGTRNLKKASPSTSSAPGGKQRLSDAKGSVSLDRLFPRGQLEESELGACFVLDNVYPLSHSHGRSQIASLLEHKPDQAAIYIGDQRLTGLNFRDFVFLDTETTGLVGAGTMAFMVGIAFFERSLANESLTVRQFFLRDHADEAAMLRFLREALVAKSGLITFNGSTFDLSVLENRYLLNRMPDDLRRLPHIDLLSLARRLWRLRLGSVALNNLERNLLDVRRTQEDVPGWLIPTIYNNYLRSQDARQLAGVFYHNEIDLLSMATLADYALRLFAHSSEDQHPADLYSLGKWQLDLGMVNEAENTLRYVVQADLPLAIYHKALERLALLLKRQHRNREALPLWQQWAATSMDEVDAHVELAKYYEWHDKDLRTAERWTLEAISLVDGWPKARAEIVRPGLIHRLARIRRKLAI